MCNPVQSSKSEANKFALMLRYMFWALHFQTNPLVYLFLRIYIDNMHSKAKRNNPFPDIKNRGLGGSYDHLGGVLGDATVRDQ